MEEARKKGKKKERKEHWKRVRNSLRFIFQSAKKTFAQEFGRAQKFGRGGRRRIFAPILARLKIRKSLLYAALKMKRLLTQAKSGRKEGWGVGWTIQKGGNTNDIDGAACSLSWEGLILYGKLSIMLNMCCSKSAHLPTDCVSGLSSVISWQWFGLAPLTQITAKWQTDRKIFSSVNCCCELAVDYCLAIFYIVFVFYLSRGPALCSWRVLRVACKRSVLLKCSNKWPVSSFCSLPLASQCIHLINNVYFYIPVNISHTHTKLPVFILYFEHTFNSIII